MIIRAALGPASGREKERGRGARWSAKTILRRHFLSLGLSLSTGGRLAPGQRLREEASSSSSPSSRGRCCGQWHQDPALLESCTCSNDFSKCRTGTSLAVQWLRLCTPTAGGKGSVPGGGTRIPHTAWCRQKKKARQSPPWLDIKILLDLACIYFFRMLLYMELVVFMISYLSPCSPPNVTLLALPVIVPPPGGTSFYLCILPRVQASASRPPLPGNLF